MTSFLYVFKLRIEKYQLLLYWIKIENFCRIFELFFFKWLKINFLMNITYHFQINELSKRFNQISEMILRFLITKNFDIDWMKILSTLQFRLNNLFNVVIERIFNEIIYDFKMREIMTIVVINIQEVVVDEKNLFTIIFDIKQKFEINKF